MVSHIMCNTEMVYEICISYVIPFNLSLFLHYRRAINGETTVSTQTCPSLRPRRSKGSYMPCAGGRIGDLQINISIRDLITF